ncbi:MFS transporter [Aerobium aerolatum]|uniref:Predicted arabinose efflux permease, MFS family n=1 Tax=Aquamicrobium aerolatum DSM 21857 TaxID=1121003 RepID=A0A1I3N4V9_9HYPH|nr:MFS transporter [Aquamicrobium aerolatum]SFJ04095.1 Predicted arabinose efflux permease, MFS family [Aquamicrobium aerolatum DSM 21857]
MSQSAPAQSVPSRLPWLIIICGCLIALLTFGPRSAMGFFQLPMLAEKGWDRTTFGLAMAFQNLAWGLGTPIFGALADKYGTGKVLALSGVMYAAGLVLMANADSATMLHIGGGVLVGLGIASGSFGIVLAAFARNVAPERRSFVFGLGTAAGSAGMFLFAPLSQGLISAYGWYDALLVMSAMMLIVPLLAIPLRGNATSGNGGQAAYRQTVAEALREALGHRSYLLLTSGFFVCGFQVAFITAHFPAYISDIGIEARYAVIALALIGFFNIIGSLAAGVIGQHYSKPMFLAWIYIGRSMLVTAFLLLPQTPSTVILFAVLMGLLWLSTVPPTNSLVAIMFGTSHLGLLGGIVFFSHQIGSFLGVWLGGYLYDLLGTYDPVWWMGVVLGLFAALVHWPIRERPVARLAGSPA